MHFWSWPVFGAKATPEMNLLAREALALREVFCALAADLLLEEVMEAAGVREVDETDDA